MPKRRWIDAVALHPDGAFAWSAGKIGLRQERQGRGKVARGALDRWRPRICAEGLRLAIAHYNGATLWFPNMDGNAEFLEWAGSHLGVTFSPDNKFLVTVDA